MTLTYQLTSTCEYQKDSTTRLVQQSRLVAKKYDLKNIDSRSLGLRHDRQTSWRCTIPYLRFLIIMIRAIHCPPSLSRTDLTLTCLKLFPLHRPTWTSSEEIRKPQPGTLSAITILTRTALLFPFYTDLGGTSTEVSTRCNTAEILP